MRDEIVLNDEVIRRFWAKVDKDGPSGCWTWTAFKLRSGHGRFSVKGKLYLATHVALILSGHPRPEPPNDWALHGDACHPSCVRPGGGHVRWGSPKDNTDDRDRLGRRADVSGTSNPRTKLVEEDVQFIRSSRLTCRALGAKFNVSPSRISAIRTRKTFADLP